MTRLMGGLVIAGALASLAGAETYQAHCKATGAIIVAEAQKPRVVRIYHTGPPDTEVTICETAVGPACVQMAGPALKMSAAPFEMKTAKPLSCVKAGGPKETDAIVGVVIEEP